ncbi:MAG TPA: 30S ribosomal protein S16 [Candidatus Saccharimonadales bacterium]|nr:30S ribosomal protein S16 [Candidatus Saccharimonadales bacterium]
MLTIRLQRTGRKGHAMFRIVVQDARVTPTSGKVVASLGSYDPHAKSLQFDQQKVSFYLEHGAQPSPRIIRLLLAEKVKLPSWVAVPSERKRPARHPEKLRANQPKETAETEKSADTADKAAPVDDAKVVASAEAKAVPAESTHPADTPADA